MISHHFAIAGRLTRLVERQPDHKAHQAMVRVCVVGAGVVGLSCAVNIQTSLPGSEVTIMADKFGKDTTSSSAGGLFRPDPSQLPGVPVDTLRNWTRLSWQHFSKLALSPDSSVSGNSVVNGFYLYDNAKSPFIDDIVFSYHQMSDEELRRINSKTRYGYNMTTVITDPGKYLPWLINRFKEKGGRVEFRRIKSLEELSAKCDVIINCCGLRADTLVGDTKMRPNRGQLVKVVAPWIRGFYYIEHAGESTYFLPHADHAVVGGCRQDGVTDVTIDPTITRDILRRGEELIPGFQGASVVAEWAGVRPYRAPLRLETEIIKYGNKHLKVVHNYGHGGHGISLSWGTAVVATQLLRDFLRDQLPQSKL